MATCGYVCGYVLAMYRLCFGYVPGHVLGCVFVQIRNIFFCSPRQCSGQRVATLLLVSATFSRQLPRHVRTMFYLNAAGMYWIEYIGTWRTHTFRAATISLRFGAVTAPKNEQPTANEIRVNAWRWRNKTQRVR